MLPKQLSNKIKDRQKNNSLRSFGDPSELIDFSSNDYLGFSKSAQIFANTHNLLKEFGLEFNGSTGSRLLTGNHKLYPFVEGYLAKIHNSDAALIYNSGYDANVGFFSSVPQRGDIVFYDQYIHASIRDGITISRAHSQKFKHNDLKDLQSKINIFKENNSSIYIVTESVFSMDGDSPDLLGLVELSKSSGAHLIVDEAHALGVMGRHGLGLCKELNIEEQIFARIITFGKALGCHGAAILGNNELKQYLINFSRSLIYTTALPPHSIATIYSAFKELLNTTAIDKLKANITCFKNELVNLQLEKHFIQSSSAVQSCVITGNEQTKNAAKHLANIGYNVKPILYPSVPTGHERLRFCLHSYNNPIEISEVLTILSKFVSVDNLQSQ